MFKKELTPGARSKVKSSSQRALRAKLMEQFPLLEPHMDDILPKKSQLELMKIPDRVSLYLLENQPLFFEHMTDPLVPHLRLVHSYPHAFPTIGIDKGAIRFVLAGASLMVPGLTSEGGRLPDPAEGERTIEAGEVAVVMAQGKEEACLVGVLNMGTEACRRDKKGVAMEAGHYLGDGLWRLVVE